MPTGRDGGTAALLETITAASLEIPGRGRAFFLNASDGAGLDEGWRDALVCEQTHKGTHDALRARGFEVRPQIDGTFDLGLIQLSKHKAVSFAAIARGLAMLVPGGWLVCAGPKDAGAGSVGKRLGQEIAGVEHGHGGHQRSFWVRRPAVLPAVCAEWRAGGEPRRVAATGFVSRPGLFAWDKIDAGSMFLADHLPAELRGAVADLGCGWGYLAARLLAERTGIARLDLFDAEWHAVEAARANVGADTRVRVHWADVAAGEVGSGAYNWVVSNPPFHAGVAAEPDLGRTFLGAAARMLKPGGTFVLVANRQMAYERALDAAFRERRVIAENPHFKVLSATAR